jgi:hypothetical protein
MFPLVLSSRCHITWAAPKPLYPLVDGAKEPCRLHELVIAVAEVPTDDNACLTTADDARSVKLKFEDPCSASCFAADVRMVVVSSHRGVRGCLRVGVGRRGRKRQLRLCWSWRGRRGRCSCWGSCRWWKWIRGVPRVLGDSRQPRNILNCVGSTGTRLRRWVAMVGRCYHWLTLLRCQGSGSELRKAIA